ncbi:DUF2971 domain-containing protein [Pseudomonas capeferrum]
MHEFLYRFRPVARLLGSTEKPGELENTEIYFASREELNDPLEGYLDVYWSGDEVVWRNLFKHYLLCLTNYALDFALCGDLIPANKKITISSTLIPPTREGEDLFNSISEDFFSNRLVSEYIKCLAINRRKIERDELSSHLFIMHQQMLYCVHKAFNDCGIHNIRLNFLETMEPQRSKFLGLCIRFLRDTAETGIDNIEIFKRSVFENKQSFLMNQYRCTKDRSNYNFLTFGFPDSFLNALDSMTFPEWYVACFMSRCDNSSIWGSYGNNHRGVCLKFKVTQHNEKYKLRLLTPVGYGHNGVLKSYTDLYFREVRYDQKHERVDFFRSLGNFPSESLEKFWYSDTEGNTSEAMTWLRDMGDEARREHWRPFMNATSSKLGVWANENEFRLVLHPSTYTLAPKDRLLKYDFNSLDGIIFGIKTPENEKVLIMKKIKELCDTHNRSTFKFYQAMYDQKSGEIKYLHMDRIKI